MGQCFLDYDGLKKFWKVVKDNFVRLGKDGSITVNAIKIKDYTDSHVLLAGGGVKPLSEFGSGGGSGSGGTISSLSNSLTIQANGTSMGSFNGSVPVTVNITTNKLINDLGAATATPQDKDYFISQFVGGGTETTTYHRRPMSALWAYIKNKTDAQYATSGHTHSNYLPLTGGTMTGDIIMGSSMQQQGLRDNSIGLIGFVKRVLIDVDSNGSPIYFTGIALQPESGAGVYINKDTFTYRGNDILHAGNIDNYLPSIVTANTDGLMSSDMFKAEKVSSISVRQGAAQFEEPIRNHDIYVTYDKDNALNSGAHMVGGDVQIKIPNATKNYDGSMSYTDKRKISHVSDNGYCTVASVFTMNVNANYSNLDALNEVEFSASDFAGMTDVLGGSNESVQPEFIRLKLLSTGVVYGYTLYESDNYLDVYKYVCYPHNSEIVYDGGMVYIQPIS